VPSESVYHFELVFLLRKWLASLGIEVFVEVNSGKKFCDIILEFQNTRCALELVAHARNGPDNRPGTVQEHFDRCLNEYKNILGVNEVWVINFTVTQKVNLIWPSDKSINVIHVQHDLNWTRATLFQSENDKGTQVHLKAKIPDQQSRKPKKTTKGKKK